MDLRDYPRPKGDTGIGVHWNAGFPIAVGIGQIRDYWLPELIAMGVKWVKIARHEGALQLSELLLKHDVMPVVRLYRPWPNPGALDNAALQAVSDLVASGVRYFEFNNEPDLGGEWQGGHVPGDAVAIVARNAIADMEAILERGGFPGVPALAPGTKWNLVGEICRLGRRDILAGPVWQAIHNYSANHPLDYPYDPGNQEGVPYTPEFYNRIASEQWGGDAWVGWSLERVNDERKQKCNRGATAFDDPTGWRAYERYDQLIRYQIGRSLPILATENGYIVGERPDPRYPATTPQLHMAQTLEACRVMMGTSSRFDHAPDYYFCTAFWLLSNYHLGHWAPDWEGQAWYSNRWPGGQLPIVAALKAEPKETRQWRGEAGIAGRVSGTVKGGARLTLKLSRPDGWSVATRVGMDERFQFTDIPLESYNLTILEANRGQEVSLSRERPTATVNFDLTDVTVIVETSAVRGVIRGGAARSLQLTRPADNWMKEQTAEEDGSYAFTGLRAGSYTLTLVGTHAVKTDIMLDGWNEAAVDLVAPGWGWEASDGGTSPGFGIIRCRVKGRADHLVRLWAPGWEGMTQRTGTKAEFGRDACEFAPLGAGRYTIQPEGTEVSAEVMADGRRVIWLTFTEHALPSAEEGVIFGTISGGAGRKVRLLRSPGTSPVAETEADADGRFRFERLAAASYTIQVLPAGSEPQTPGEAPLPVVGQADIVIDGSNQVQVDLALPVETEVRWVVEDGGPGPGFSLVRCQVVGQTGRAVSLWTSGWGGITQITGNKPEFGPDTCEFSPLGPGTYFVELEEPAQADGTPQTVRAEVRLEPNRVAWVRFLRPGAVAPPVPLEPAMPVEPPAPVVPPVPTSDSVIAGSVTAGEGLWVLLSGPEGDRQAAVSDGRYAFFGLSAGRYRVAVFSADPALGELAAREDVAVDGTSQVAVDFELPARGQAQSRVYGRVRGGAGRLIMLEGPLEEKQGDSVRAEAATVTQDDTFSFDGLPAGTYQATLRDTDPPSGNTQLQAGILLDGRNAVRVDFDPGTPGQGKTLDHYVFVGSLARSKDDFMAALRYVARFRPVVGNDEAEARKARHVTILGSVGAVSALAEQGLRLSGCQVQRIEGDLAASLGKLVEEGRPY